MNRDEKKKQAAERLVEVALFLGYVDVADMQQGLGADRVTLWRWRKAGSVPQRGTLVALFERSPAIRNPGELARYVLGGQRPRWFHIQPDPTPPGASIERIDDSGAEIIEFQAPGDHADRVSASALYDSPIADPEPLLAAVSCARRISPRALVVGGELQELTALVLQAAETIVLPGDTVSAINNKKYMMRNTPAA